MPYSSPSEAPDYVPEGKKAQWVKVWNSAYNKAKKDGKSDKEAEEIAFREANGVTGKSAVPEVKKSMKLDNIFIPIKKVDAEQRLVYGVLAAETPDLSGEILDYESSKAAFADWSDGISKVTEGKSKGNLRVMHNPKVAGKFTQLEFNDADKQVEVVAKVEADDEWKLVETGCYTGFSIGAKAAWRKKDETNPKLTRYAVGKMIEGSLVDLPCIPTATFEYIKAGQAELRKFVVMENSTKTAEAAYVPDVMADFKAEFKTVLPMLEKISTADRVIGFTQKTAQSAGIKKSLWSVSDLACLLMSADYIRQNLKFEAEIEGDGSPIPEKLRSWIDEGAALLSELVAEETAELTSDEPLVAPEAADIEMAASAEVEKAAEETPVAETKPEVTPEEVEKTVVAEAAPVEKTEKVEEAPVVDVEKSVEAIVEKKFGEAVSKLNGKFEEQDNALKTLTDSVKTITEMLEVIKSLPMPSKAVSAQAVAITKAQDSGAPVVEEVKDVKSAFKMALAPERGKVIG